MSLPDAPRKKALSQSKPSPSIWRTVKAVAWGFFGVRKDSAYQEDIATLTPLSVIIVGLIAAMLFVGGLILLVNHVAAP